MNNQAGGAVPRPSPETLVPDRSRGRPSFRDRFLCPQEESAAGGVVRRRGVQTEAAAKAALQGIHKGGFGTAEAEDQLRAIAGLMNDEVFTEQGGFPPDEATGEGKPGLPAPEPPPVEEEEHARLVRRGDECAGLMRPQAAPEPDFAGNAGDRPRGNGAFPQFHKLGFLSQR